MFVSRFTFWDVLDVGVFGADPVVAYHFFEDEAFVVGGHWFTGLL